MSFQFHISTINISNIQQHIAIGINIGDLMLQLVQYILNLGLLNVIFCAWYFWPGISGSGLSSSGSSAPFSSKSGPFSFRPSKFGPSIFDIEVLNEFSHCHPHQLRIVKNISP